MLPRVEINDLPIIYSIRQRCSSPGHRACPPLHLTFFVFLGFKVCSKGKKKIGFDVTG